MMVFRFLSSVFFHGSITITPVTLLYDNNMPNPKSGGRCLRFEIDVYVKIINSAIYTSIIIMYIVVVGFYDPDGRNFVFNVLVENSIKTVR